ncbi:putative gamma-secretase subunit PEN-2 [Tetrabaena socialis]|uniref:Putative gamma-secretase subunit PEN-2 n=1 Tax=Tetrabaena socialis TaxID=47790 RepID=A0A2J8A995_9CHLO|nr:putative gamma-secretase subunit PEN-2 [Tetrabaena socialis]|eukprot:PNH09071.1 putative gamma-secretase subunit PEN-2 [Tetrabaena socialis]
MDNDHEAGGDEGIVDTVDYEALPAAKARLMSRRMFLGGFFFLPLMWGANVWLFWPDFRAPRGDPVIKRYTKYSAVGFTVATVLFLPWLLLYAIAGESILSYKVYHALDAASLDLSAYGLGIINPSS